jgi:hypothetical protein
VVLGLHAFYLPVTLILLLSRRWPLSGGRGALAVFCLLASLGVILYLLQPRVARSFGSQPAQPDEAAPLWPRNRWTTLNRLTALNSALALVFGLLLPRMAAPAVSTWLQIGLSAYGVFSAVGLIYFLGATVWHWYQNRFVNAWIKAAWLVLLAVGVYFYLAGFFLYYLIVMELHGTLSRPAAPSSRI